MAAFFLRRGDTLSVSEGAGADLKVAAGDVWLMQLGDSMDCVIKGGEGIRISSRATVLVYAFADARVEFEGRAIIGVRRRGDMPGDPVEFPPASRPDWGCILQ